MKAYCAMVYNGDEKYFLSLSDAKNYILNSTNNLKLKWSTFGDSWNYGTIAKIVEINIE